VALRTKEGQLKELSRAGQQALKSQPFSALIGARLTSLSEGKAVLEVPIREELLQQNGCVAGGSVLGPVVLTSEYKINYLRPASGETLVARASVVNTGRSQAVCRCEVFTTGAGRKETLCAAALGTSVSVSAPREA
jgi:acyl-coenzyme A thioesterase PaaI-like protein